MKTMYLAQVNSPGTELAAAIDATQDTIQVADGSVLPDAPNLLTVGTDEAAETILYTVKTGDELSGVTRGFQGTAQSWAMGTKVARYFTAYDHDAAIGNISELSAGLNALGDETKDRFDIEQREDVILSPGMQILNAQRNAAFSLSGIKGRTLVNLLGRDGNCEKVDAFSRWFNSNQEVDTTNKVFGSASLKITVTSSVDRTGGIFKVMTPQVKPNSYYILKCYFKNIDLPDSIKPEVLMKVTDSEGDRLVGNYAGTMNKNTFSMTYGKAYTKSNLTEFVVYARIPGGSAEVGNSFNIDGFSLYEISATEYAALDTMTPEQVAAKYPYVDSVQPVRNPYAIRYGENLLPPFYRWLDSPMGGNYDYSTTDNTLSFVGEADKSYYKYLDVPLMKNTVYRLSAEHNGYLSVTDPIRNTILVPNTSEQFKTFNSGETEVARIYLSNVSHVGQAGKFTFKNPMLTLGSTPKPFKPREDSMLALQTDLFADPLTGANADEVFEKDGQYFKLAKWKKIVLDGERLYTFQGHVPGFKWIKFAITNGPRQNQDNAFYMTKFDGKYNRHMPGSLGSGTLPDQMDYDGGGNLVYVSISNTDSGWGDNYTPTVDEIKAYFMGWVMRQDGTVDQPYTSGIKFWRQKLDNSNPTSVLPTTPAPNWTPYQLVYQLATPTVESIVSEGMLTFNEGDNQVEVGTGIVVRESVKPQLYDNKYWINGTLSAGVLSKKPFNIMSVYKNNLYDTAWKTITHSASSFATYGLEQAYIGANQYDPSAVYSVTYLMLDTSPVAPFAGSYATNEKAMLQELTEAVQQNATAVSVLMNKKADKDSPGWITPTLLNGWVNFGTGYEAAYKKTSFQEVRIKGLVKSGAINSVLFYLPSGCRPKGEKNFIVLLTDGATEKYCRISIGANGAVQQFGGGSVNTAVSLDISFLAEQ